MTSDKTLSLYNDNDFVKRNKDSLDKLRQLTKFIDYKSYRGFGREQLTSHPFYPVGLDRQIEELREKGTWDNLNARKKLADIEYSQGQEEFSFNNLQDAKNVYALIEDKSDYEIIEITDDKEIDEKTLGFDIGIWWSSYSLIADTLIIPMWHPPGFNDFNDIIKIGNRLNKNSLFDKYEDADEFLKIYLTKGWGEKEMTTGQFKIYQIRAV